MTAEAIHQPPATELPTPVVVVPRLWPAIALVSVFWIGFFIVNSLEKPYFTAFIYSVAAPAVLLLLFSIWWWCNRKISWRDRFVGCFLVIGTAVVVAPLCHPSVYFAIPTVGLPLALTVLTAWMLFVNVTGFAWKRLGLLVALLSSWACFALLRVDGVNADLKSTSRWRWTPSPEEVFLKENETRRLADVASAAQVLSHTPLTLAAGDWPAFRGADREGKVRGVTIATDWLKTPPQLRWNRRVGPAWSSVIVIGNRLFTQEQRGDRECVVCYDASTGAEIWEHSETARFSEAISGPGPRATPTFADGRIFSVGATGMLHCLDAATGKSIWSHNVATEVNAKQPMWGFASSPLVVDDKVIVFAGGESAQNLLAYLVDSGERVWTASASHDSYSSPQLVILGGQPQCLMLGDRGLTAVDPHTGKGLWQFGWVMPGAPRTAQVQVIGKTQLFASTLNSPGVSLAEVQQLDGEWKASEIWSMDQPKPEFPDFVVHEGYAYGFDGPYFCCLDLATGKRCWKAGRYGRGQVVLLTEQSLLLVICENGEAVLLAAEPQQHRELGRFQALSEKTWNHPVIAHGRLYIRNAEELACYDLAGFQQK